VQFVTQCYASEMVWPMTAACNTLDIIPITDTRVAVGASIGHRNEIISLGQGY